MMPPPSTGNPEQDRINMEDFRRQEESMRRFYDDFAGVGTLNPVQVAGDNRAMQTVGIGSTIELLQDDLRYLKSNLIQL